MNKKKLEHATQQFEAVRWHILGHMDHAFGNRVLHVNGLESFLEVIRKTL